MASYHQNIMIIILIVISFLVLLTYGLKLNFGVGQLSMLAAGEYGLYLNLRAINTTWRQ